MTGIGFLVRRFSSCCTIAVAFSGLLTGGGAARAGANTTFRINTLELRDPHVFVLFLGTICDDTTALVNNETAAMIESDGDQDGFADLNLLFAFAPLDPSAACSAVAAGEGLCTVPLAETICSRDPRQQVDLLVHANQLEETCLAPLPGTTRPYAPAVTSPTAPCFVTEPFALRWAPFPAPIVMEHAEIAATYSGEPPSGLLDGLLSGFISEAQADAVLFPPTFPVVGGMPLSTVLPGGTGNCAGHDDRDFGPDGVTRGWWLYWNFTAEHVTFTCENAADADTSCSVDLADFRTLRACLDGGPGDDGECLCHRADLNNDLFVDLRDYAALQRCFSGRTGIDDPACVGP